MLIDDPRSRLADFLMILKHLFWNHTETIRLLIFTLPESHQNVGLTINLYAEKFVEKIFLLQRVMQFYYLILILLR